ncbi:kinase-like protein [Ceratobasidium sp. AG-I]|nr:kinase-like protein [Ceratobasidium sp. AG-I]
MANARARQPLFLLKGELLGSGGYSKVYRAKESGTGRTVALKQSRASLRVRRTLLQHEARVLKILAGHSTIPEVFGYGRIKHFELLAMQPLYQSLGELINETGPLPLAVVWDIVDQLLCSLDHIHGCGIVHRDVKPGNILLKLPGQWQLCLIDFGLSYRPKIPKKNQKVLDGLDGPVNVFGTLPFASLNAHRTSDLNFGDDLESLAYTLIFLLRGSLPWCHYTRHGSLIGRLRQVYEQKKSYSGQRLASGLPEEFGSLVDYARSLPASMVPDHAEWQKRFRRHQCQPQTPVSALCAKPIVGSDSFTQPSPPVEIGQLIVAQVMSAVSIEGCSAQAGHEGSYIHDTSLTSQEWSTLPKPGVVIDVGWDSRARLYNFTLVAVGQPQQGIGALDLPNVPIVGPKSGDTKLGDAILSVEPNWPLEHSYCYAFKNPVTFYCLPSQVPITAFWRTNASGAALLGSKLHTRHNPLEFYRELNSSNPDVRHSVRMRRSHVKIYASILPLTPEHVEDASKICWHSNRAWFDECVKISRRRDLDDGRWWTRALFKPGYEAFDNQDDISDSYREDDYEDWDPQQERSNSLTLTTETREQDVVSELLDEIVLV